MTNSIRTPRQGVTGTSRRIAQAVDNEEWQKFRVSLKGTSTAEKLDALQGYWTHSEHNRKPVLMKLKYKDEMVEQDPHYLMRVAIGHCDVCIRVDNYLKALMRGGQLVPFLDLSYFVNCSQNGKWRDVMSTEYIDGLRRKVSVIKK